MGASCFEILDDRFSGLIRDIERVARKPSGRSCFFTIYARKAQTRSVLRPTTRQSRLRCS